MPLPPKDTGSVASFANRSCNTLVAIWARQTLPYVAKRERPHAAGKLGQQSAIARSGAFIRLMPQIAHLKLDRVLSAFRLLLPSLKSPSPPPLHHRLAPRACPTHPTVQPVPLVHSHAAMRLCTLQACLVAAVVVLSLSVATSAQSTLTGTVLVLSKDYYTRVRAGQPRLCVVEALRRGGARRSVLWLLGSGCPIGGAPRAIGAGPRRLGAAARPSPPRGLLPPKELSLGQSPPLPAPPEAAPPPPSPHRVPSPPPSCPAAARPRGLCAPRRRRQPRWRRG